MFRQMSPKAIVAIMVVAAAFLTQPMRAQNTGSLQGVVKDSSGAPLSGAFVKLMNAERRLTFMVISQTQGRYTMSKLPPGQYTVQGIGHGFQSERSAPVDVTAGLPATVDLSLTVPQEGQMQPTGRTEAATSPPVPEGEGKQIIQARCVACHSTAQIFRKRADRQNWQTTIEEMREYIQGTTFAQDLTDQEEKIVLDYVAENFSDRGGEEGGRRGLDPNSHLPKVLLQGEAAKYLVVDYELPIPNSEPHDVTVDSDGFGWVNERHRNGGHLGLFDPEAFTYTRIALPAAQSDRLRLYSVESRSQDKVWLIDGGPNRRWLVLDTKTREFNVFPAPKVERGGNLGVNTIRVHPSGTVWMTSLLSNQIVKLNPATKDFTAYDIPAGVQAGRNSFPYGMAISGDEKIWFAERDFHQMGRLDPATGKIDEFPIPLQGNVLPRRMGSDAEGNLWVALNGIGKLMKIDYQTTEMTVYTPPTSNSGAYSVDVDLERNLVWVSEQSTDIIARFNPQTEIWVEFPLPNPGSDVRRIEVDLNHPNRIWWAGTESNRVGYIEMLD